VTPDLWHALLGGMLIGGGAAVLLLVDGRIAGISGILEHVTRGAIGVSGWRLLFLAGLIAPAAAIGVGTIDFAQGVVLTAVSGLLVGFGTRLGSGCTSGHGVCGISNLSPRSLAATLTFMGVAMLVVFAVRHAGAAWRG
jgi:uncharacterized membrane protein YedE/YeeE